VTNLPFIGLLGKAAGYLISQPSPERSIGGLVADVTIEEDHVDELVITDHPVEQGSTISDHAFKKPARLTVRVGYSNSSIGATGGTSLLGISIGGVTGLSAVQQALSSINGTGDVSYVQQYYNAFLALQANMTPLDVFTAKRVYSNMLIESLQTETDVKTENAMILTVRMREVIIVTTTTATIGNSANMSNPSDNGAPLNQGTQTLSTSTNYNSAAGASILGAGF
jgi:hypothetical protein